MDARISGSVLAERASWAQAPIPEHCHNNTDREIPISILMRQ
jgi:hypothetical protein